MTIKVKPDTKAKLERFQSKYRLKLNRKLDNNEAIALALDEATKSLRLDENGEEIDDKEEEHGG